MEDNNYKMEPTCQWCLKRPTGNKDYKMYLDRGNICSVCSADIAHRVWQRNYEAEITRKNRDIEECRKEMDLLGECLDANITEEERVDIVSKMEQIYIKIKLLKQ